MAQPILVGWSGGKDCTLALHALAASDAYAVTALLTTITSGYDRISMHGVRRTLLAAQAASLGMPLHEVEISPQCSNEEYGGKMRSALAAHRAAEPALEQVMFGDLFLEDVRAYRERMLALVGMRGLYPLWGRDTRALAAEFSALGFRAVVVCVDSRAIPAELAGREYDAEFVRDLPAGADPCGENGEFHTFVYDGPIFSRPVAHARGEIVVRDERFVYADLLEAPNPPLAEPVGAEPARRDRI